jgi:hypothetical protein
MRQKDVCLSPQRFNGFLLRSRPFAEAFRKHFQAFLQVERTRARAERDGPGRTPAGSKHHWTQAKKQQEGLS